MPITAQAIARLMQALRLDTPIVAIYDSAPDPDFEPLVEATGRACSFAYYKKWVQGHTLVVRRGEGDFAQPRHGCPGMQRAFGLEKTYPPWMANFLTDGKNGAPMGEGLKATPALAEEFLDRAQPPVFKQDAVLMGPLKPERFSEARSLTFFADPDRLSALMTLAAYHSSDPEEIAAPFSSGCALMLRELESFGRDRAVLGCTDVAMRRHLPPELLCLTVTPQRFARMLEVPEASFMFGEWWAELLAARKL